MSPTRFAPVLLFVLAAPMMLAGCTDCQPLLEVRNCLPEQCEPSSNAVTVTWNGTHAAAWPDIDRLMDKATPGKHDHATWTRTQEQDFWAYWGLEGDKKEVIIKEGDATFRIRVLTCD